MPASSPKFRQTLLATFDMDVPRLLRAGREGEMSRAKKIRRASTST